MDVGIDTEKTNLFEPGVDNPGMDEDIELHPMTSSRRVRLILQVFTKHMKKLHSVETHVILRHYLSEKKMLTTLGK